MAGFRYWQDMKWPDFSDIDPARTVAVLPVGAIEQHGPHMPLLTDTLIAEEVVKRAANNLDDAMDVLILPTQPVGKSNEHIAYPGTLTLSSQTLISLWLDIGASVARAGVKKLILLNAHGGQRQIADIVARELRVDHKMFCLAVNWWEMGMPEDLIPAHEAQFGIHAGTVETSMLLEARPDLVDMSKAENFEPSSAAIAARYQKLKLLGGPGAGWQAQDLHPAGAAGDATTATAKIGKAIFDHVVDGFCVLLQEVANYPLSALKPGPLDAPEQ